MTKEELAQKIKDSNYTCEGINCSECISVNGFGCCLQCDKKLFVSLVLPAKSKKDKLEKRIEELEKENTELKKELKDANEKVVHLACNQNKDLKYKLIQAKELLERFLGLGNLWNLDCKDYFPLRKEVEQFLNSEVEK